MGWSDSGILVTWLIFSRISLWSDTVWIKYKTVEEISNAFVLIESLLMLRLTSDSVSSSFGKLSCFVSSGWLNSRTLCGFGKKFKSFLSFGWFKVDWSFLFRSQASSFMRTPCVLRRDAVFGKWFWVPLFEQILLFRSIAESLSWFGKVSRLNFEKKEPKNNEWRAELWKLARKF